MSPISLYSRKRERKRESIFSRNLNKVEIGDVSRVIIMHTDDGRLIKILHASLPLSKKAIVSISEY